jgi:hypothetical protein
VEPPTEQGSGSFLPIVGDIKRKRLLRIENESILTDVKKWNSGRAKRRIF